MPKAGKIAPAYPLQLAHPLDGITAKLARAIELTRIFEEAEAAYFAGSPAHFRVEGRLNPKKTSFVFTGYGPAQPPLRFSVIAGEILQHLRASLDYQVVALAEINGQPALLSHQFPLATSAKAFDEAINSSALTGVPDQAVARMRNVQPFMFGPGRSPLGVLSQLNNQDKHRLPVLVSVAARLDPELGIGGAPSQIRGLGDPCHKVVSPKGVEVFRVKLARPSPGFHAEANFTPRISFAALGAYENYPTVAGLRELTADVQRAIESFRSFFPARREASM